MSERPAAAECTHQRSTDGFFGFLTRFWDWIDERDIDKHAVSVAIMVGTVQITKWSMWFAGVSTLPGIERAAIIAAVSAPYMALQAAAISFYFRART